ncbi:MAG: hypothetical protein R3B92_04105 [Patescibacteria group bacterium]
MDDNNMPQTSDYNANSTGYDNPMPIPLPQQPPAFEDTTDTVAPAALPSYPMDMPTPVSTQSSALPPVMPSSSPTSTSAVGPGGFSYTQARKELADVLGDDSTAAKLLGLVINELLEKTSSSGDFKGFVSVASAIEKVLTDYNQIENHRLAGRLFAAQLAGLKQAQKLVNNQS